MPDMKPRPPKRMTAKEQLERRLRDHAVVANTRKLTIVVVYEDDDNYDNLAVTVVRKGESPHRAFKRVCHEQINPGVKNPTHFMDFDTFELEVPDNG